MLLQLPFGVYGWDRVHSTYCRVEVMTADAQTLQTSVQRTSISSSLGSFFCEENQECYLVSVTVSGELLSPAWVNSFFQIRHLFAILSSLALALALTLPLPGLVCLVCQPGLPAWSVCLPPCCSSSSFALQHSVIYSNCPLSQFRRTLLFANGLYLPNKHIHCRPYKKMFQELTFNFSYVLGDSLVLFRFRLRKLVITTSVESPSSVTGVSQRLSDSSLWRCSATICSPLSPNQHTEKIITY